MTYMKLETLEVPDGIVLFLVIVYETEDKYKSEIYSGLFNDTNDTITNFDNKTKVSSMPKDYKTTFERAKEILSDMSVTSTPKKNLKNAYKSIGDKDWTEVELTNETIETYKDFFDKCREYTKCSDIIFSVEK